MNYKNKYWFLVKQFAISDFKLRYNNSILGYFWSLMNPLLQFGVLLLVFSIFLRFDVPHYNVYLLLGVIMWSFLAESTNNAMDSLLGKSSLIKNTNFPRSIIIIASNITTSMGFILNLIVLLIFFIVFRVKLSVTMFFFPFYLIFFFLLIAGLSLFLSALYVRFRDIQHIWRIFLQIGFWLTPIVYPLSIVPEKFRFLFNINPMYGIIHNSREILIYGNMPEIYSTFSLMFLSLVLLFIGYFTFSKLSNKFAEYL